MKRQTIAFDLDGTLIPECGEFSCVRTNGIARLLSKRALRRDSHALLRSLVFAGNRVVVYTLDKRRPEDKQSARRLKMWFWLQGIPVARVITKQEHEKRLRKQGVPPFAFKAPHLFGIDLLVDDCPHTVEAVRESGTSAVLVSNRESDWTLVVRTACRLRQSAYTQHQPT
jgi:phosphoglycolate phosphatase-like HAD superfamily hydrolase